MKSAPHIQNAKGNPLAAGNIELAQARVEEFRSGKGIKGSCQPGNRPGSPTIKPVELRPPKLLHEQPHAIAAQNEGGEQHKVIGDDQGGRALQWNTEQAIEGSQRVEAE